MKAGYIPRLYCVNIPVQMTSLIQLQDTLFEYKPHSPFRRGPEVRRIKRAAVLQRQLPLHYQGNRCRTNNVLAGVQGVRTFFLTNFSEVNQTPLETAASERNTGQEGIRNSGSSDLCYKPGRSWRTCNRICRFRPRYAKSSSDRSFSARVRSGWIPRRVTSVPVSC